MIAVNRNRIRFLFIFLINKLFTINDPKFSEFLYSGLFGYITSKSSLTFLLQQNQSIT